MGMGGTAKGRAGSNPLGLAVMALLHERPMHPYEIAATLRERAKEESIKLNYGSLYTVVAALERAGLIAARQTTRQGARPERTVYEITKQGGLELVSWMRQLLSTPAKEYPRFEAALSLMLVLPPGEVALLLRERLRRLRDDAKRVRAELDAVSAQGLERVHLIEAEYALAMRAAERAWVARLLGLIERSPGFTRTWRQWHEGKRKVRSSTSRGAAGPRQAKGKTID
jgi:DNA-binding PadR family transcriptional regulator